MYADGRHVQVYIKISLLYTKTFFLRTVLLRSYELLGKSVFMYEGKRKQTSCQTLSVKYVERNNSTEDKQNVIPTILCDTFMQH